MPDDSVAAWLPVLLQTNDALFPTGAYAHSFGFEELVRMRGIRDEAGLRECADLHVIPALARQELPYLRFAHEALPDFAEFCAVDREISAWKIARELREASMQIGGRRLAALRAGRPHPLYQQCAAAIRNGELPGHHLSICAVQASVEGFPLQAALVAYAYQSVAGLCSAALKLIRVGQEACQRVLRHALRELPVALEVSNAMTRDHAGCFDPALEIAAMRHEFANERLFIS